MPCTLWQRWVLTTISICDQYAQVAYSNCYSLVRDVLMHAHMPGALTAALPEFVLLCVVKRALQRCYVYGGQGVL